MPIHRCEEEGQQGWQWGEQGKCYLDADYGGSDEAKQKAIAQAVAAGASPDEFAAVELATLHDVPVLRAGTHHSHNAGDITLSEDDLDEILEGSTALIPIVKESFETGVYRGNEDLHLSKMPGFLNFVHDGLLNETIKDRTKGVDVSYGKTYFEDPITGERTPWITQTFRDVPHDIAEAIRTRFPKRSVELIPFTDPTSGKDYRMAIRSTAFLNKTWIETPPAVSGQTDDLQIEFSRDDNPVLVLFSGTPPQEIPAENINTIQQEDIMSETTTVPVPENDVTELAEKYERTVEELQAYKEMHEAQDAKIAELQRRDAQRDVQEFMKDLQGTQIIGADGVIYSPSKAFCDLIDPLISNTAPGAVIELANGQQPVRQVLMTTVKAIVEMAGKDGGMLVAMGQVAPRVNTQPEGEEKPKTVVELMEEYQSEGLSVSDAWKKANAKTYEGGY